MRAEWGETVGKTNSMANLDGMTRRVDGFLKEREKIWTNS